jgi:hypothetical protein
VAEHSEAYMTPVEKNARRLVNVIAKHFPDGGTSEELRRRFEIETTLKAPETFYAALRYCKARSWLTGGNGRNLPYFLSGDASWRPPEPPSIGESLRAMERNQLEHVAGLEIERADKLEIVNRRLRGSKKAIANGQALGGAIGALMAIMLSTTINTRRRIQAAEQLLMYKSPEDIAAQAKLFLSSIFTSDDENIDNRLMATTALRKSEDVRIMPAIERPPPRGNDDGLTPEQRRQQLAEEMAARRKYIEAKSRELEAEMGLPPAATDTPSAS